MKLQAAALRTILLLGGSGIGFDVADAFAPSGGAASASTVALHSSSRDHLPYGPPPSSPPPPPVRERVSVDIGPLAQPGDIESEGFGNRRNGGDLSRAPGRGGDGGVSVDINPLAQPGLIRDLESETFGNRRNGGPLSRSPGRGGGGGRSLGDSFSNGGARQYDNGGDSYNSLNEGNVIGGASHSNSPSVRRRTDYGSSPPRSNSNDGGGRQWWESAPEGVNNHVQGVSRRTFQTPLDSSSQRIVLETDGRPLDTTVEIWDGPNNTPTSMKVKSEDGRLRPFRALVRTPDRMGRTNSVDVRNVGPLEFPLRVGVDQGKQVQGGQAGPGSDGGTSANANDSPDTQQQVPDVPMDWTTVQGAGALRTFSIDHSVSQVLVSIKTDGYPMNAKVELWGTSTHLKQVAEIYNDDGYKRPFEAIVDVPGGSNTIGITNTGPMEYPITASVTPIAMEDFGNSSGGYDNDGMSQMGQFSDPYSLRSSQGGGGGRRNIY